MDLISRRMADDQSGRFWVHRGDFQISSTYVGWDKRL